MDWCRLPASCAVSVKAFPTAASARQTASGSGRGSVRCWLLALFGPVAVRVKAVPVVPGVVRLLRGAMMRRRNSSSNSSVEAREGASVAVWASGLWVVRRCSTTSFVGFPARQDGVDAARCPGQLVFQHGVGAGAGLAHAVLDVGQGAHGELQAVGQVGAVAVAQRDAPTHDVVAEPFQVASVHESIMTHHERQCRVAMPYFFHPLHEEVEIISVALQRDRP